MSPTDYVMRPSLMHKAHEEERRIWLLLLFLTVLLTSCQRKAPIPESHKDSGTTPPNLKTCTRLDVRYMPSARKYLMPSSGLEAVLLTEQEANGLDSLRTIVVEDQESIHAFADKVGSAQYVNRRQPLSPSEGTSSPPTQVSGSISLLSMRM
jgi:hypothetical protein